MSNEFIRQATAQDIDALVDIYIESFPERVKEVFGGPHRRVFIGDYLLFYLAWDPTSNWVYVKDGDLNVTVHKGRAVLDLTLDSADPGQSTALIDLARVVLKKIE